MQDLRPNAFDYATFILTVIAHDLADPRSPLDPFAFTVTETFTPRRKAVIVNSLWLLSLLISLTCALMAMSLHKWARRHETITPRRRSLTEQARIRVFITAGVDSRTFRTVIGILPAFVHLSMFLFVLGFVVFLCGVHHVVFIVASCWVALCALGYLYTTILPFFRPESPFYTPLSNLIAPAYLGQLQHSNDGHHVWDITKFAEDKARRLSLEMDGDVLKRTFSALNGDHDLEQFLEAIPGFCDSKMVDDPLYCLDILGRQRLAEALVGFWDRTLSSNLVSGFVKERRLTICLEAIKAADLAIAVPRILGTIFSRGVVGVSRFVEIGHSLGKLRNSNVASLARGMIASIITNAERDRRWSLLAMDELAVSEDALRNYLAHGDSVLLANLIHIVRHLFVSLREGHRDLAHESLCILPTVSRFDIFDTLPELQREFCNLWNLIAHQARNSGVGDNPFIKIIVEILHLYIALHRPNANSTGFLASTTGNDAILRRPASCPSCEISSHHPVFTYPKPEAAGDMTGGASHAPTVTSYSDPPPSDVPVEPYYVSSSAVAKSSPLPPTESRTLPTISPFSGTGTAQEIAVTSPRSSVVKYMSRSSSSPGNVPRPNEETTATQTQPTHHPGQSDPPTADIVTDNLRSLPSENPA